MATTTTPIERALDDLATEYRQLQDQLRVLHLKAVAAHEAGATWKQIATVLDSTLQTVWRHFGPNNPPS